MVQSAASVCQFCRFRLHLPFSIRFATYRLQQKEAKKKNKPFFTILLHRTVYMLEPGSKYSQNRYANNSN